MYTVVVGLLYDIAEIMILNVEIGPQMRNSSEFVKMAVCFRSILQTFKHCYLRVICPQLLNSYLNCNIDALFATYSQFYLKTAMACET